MQHSESFKAIPAALLEVQRAVQPAQKSTENEYFSSKYADLESVIASVRPLMVENGLSLMQFPSTRFDQMVATKATMREGDGRNKVQKIVDINVPVIEVETRLDHPESGEWASHTFSMLPMDNSPQAIGSTITYARRYSLNAILGLVSEDDDGNAGSDAQNRQNLPSGSDRHTAPSGDAGQGGSGGGNATPRARSGGKPEGSAKVPFNEGEQQKRNCINGTLVSELVKAVKSAKGLEPAKFIEWLDEYLDHLYAALEPAGYVRKYRGDLSMRDIPSSGYNEILEAVTKSPKEIIDHKPDWQKRIDGEAAEERGDDGVV